MQPFASLLDSVSRFTPVLMLNRELPGVTDSSSDDEDGDNGSGQKSNDQEKEQVDNWNGIRRFLFLKGDIEASIARIAEDINWEL